MLQAAIGDSTNQLGEEMGVIRSKRVQLLAQFADAVWYTAKPATGG